MIKIMIDGRAFTGKRDTVVAVAQALEANGWKLDKSDMFETSFDRPSADSDKSATGSAEPKK